MDFPSAWHYPLATINPPSGHLSLNPCRVILHPVTLHMLYIKLEASESASADHHDKKSVLRIGGKNPDRSIPNISLNFRYMFSEHTHPKQMSHSMQVLN